MRGLRTICGFQMSFYWAGLARIVLCLACDGLPIASHGVKRSAPLQKIRSRILYNLLPPFCSISLLALVFQFALSAGNMVEASDKKDAIPAEVQEIMTIPVGILDEEVIKKVREAAGKNEIASVVFALDNIGSKDSKRDLASLRVMRAFEVRTLEHLEAIVSKGQQLDARLKQGLGRWGRYVDEPRHQQQ